MPITNPKDEPIKRSLTSLDVLPEITTPAIGQDIDVISLRDTTTDIAPTSANPRADRDFEGNGPSIVLGTELTTGHNGRAVFVSIIFSAREDGDNCTKTATPTRLTEVWH